MPEIGDYLSGRDPQMESALIVAHAAGRHLPLRQPLVTGSRRAPLRICLLLFLRDGLGVCLGLGLGVRIGLLLGCLLAFLLLAHVVPDRATCCRARKAVTAGYVAGGAADQCAFQAAGAGDGRYGGERHGEGQRK
jgi:hypothetical protein